MQTSGDQYTHGRNRCCLLYGSRLQIGFVSISGAMTEFCFDFLPLVAFPHSWCALGKVLRWATDRRCDKLSFRTESSGIVAMSLRPQLTPIFFHSICVLWFAFFHFASHMHIDSLVPQAFRRPMRRWTHVSPCQRTVPPYISWLMFVFQIQLVSSTYLRGETLRCIRTFSVYREESITKLATVAIAKNWFCHNIFALPSIHIHISFQLFYNTKT